MYYALTDKFAGDNPKEATVGFANSSEALAFRTKSQRDEWLASTNLLKAAPISRDQALKMTSWQCGDFYGKPGYSVKVVRIYDTYDADGVISEYHNLAAK